ncbi:type I 3-dehydroquinate dehydratase [Haloferax namakaokahaiae]|uniref:3-dehydroquinate dehydratase n=1 Tax=Haloferax namakaokahaiae TaxID=1748331 RepID=A0ABD5ZJS3_9EURY
MNLDGFVLAATTNDLTREPQVRDVADVLEFRMDKAEDPITQLSEYDGELSIIATNRAHWFGGQALDTGRLDRLFTASEFDAVEMVDIELETARGSQWVIPEFRDNGVEIIISFHAFEDTPDKETLDAIFEQCARYGDIAKVATYAENNADALRMLQSVHTSTSKGIDVAGISMGELGSHTRVVAPLYGSKIGYAPLKSDKSEYAPGQIPIHDLESMIKTLSVSDQKDIQVSDIDEAKADIQSVTTTD